MLSSEENRLQLGLKRHDKGSGPRECLETHFQDCEKKQRGESQAFASGNHFEN